MVSASAKVACGSRLTTAATKHSIFSLFAAMLALRSFAARRHSTTTRPLDYLQTWVGGGASNAAASKPDQHGSSSEGNFRTSAGPSVPPGAGVANLPHVSITGNTFLLPTVKLPRSVTPDTLHSALQAAAAASPAARNLLQGRGAGVPLVVDLAEVSERACDGERWQQLDAPPSLLSPSPPLCSSSPTAPPTLSQCTTRSSPTSWWP